MNKHARVAFAVAKRELAEAESILKHKFIASAVSRAYYAIFHAAQAVLETRGSEPITHRGVNSEFHRIFVKSREVEKEFGDILSQTAMYRRDVDYEVTEHDSIPDLDTTREIVANAKKFVQKMGEILQAGE